MFSVAIYLQKSPLRFWINTRVHSGLLCRQEYETHFIVEAVEAVEA